MRLTKKGTYALNIVEFLAKNNHRPVSAQEVAEAYSLSPQYTSQIMAHLRDSRIITSRRGPGGGYFLVSLTTPIVSVLESAGEVMGIMDESDQDGLLCKKVVDHYLGSIKKLKISDLIEQPNCTLEESDFRV